MSGHDPNDGIPPTDASVLKKLNLAPYMQYRRRGLTFAPSLQPQLHQRAVSRTLAALLFLVTIRTKVSHLLTPQSPKMPRRLLLSHEARSSPPPLLISPSSTGESCPEHLPHHCFWSRSGQLHHTQFRPSPSEVGEMSLCSSADRSASSTADAFQVADKTMEWGRRKASKTRDPTSA